MMSALYRIARRLATTLTHMTPQTIRRPAGVTASAVVLGLAAAVLLVFAALMVVAAVAAGHMPIAATSHNNTPPPSPAVMTAMMTAFACFYLTLAGWAVTTLVGLLKMKTWARISVMIIGGGLALIGLFSAVTTAAMPLLIKSKALPASNTPPPDSAVMTSIFLCMAAAWLAAAGVGIWWLIYFLLRSTREAFTLANAPPAPQPTSSFFVEPTPPSPLDFTVAQPLPPSPPAPPQEAP
jgi:hypothetical protein